MKLSVKTATIVAVAMLASATAGVHVGGGKESPASVKISYTLHKIPAIASNQIAVWIEDGSGIYVKTVFATRFTAKGGFKKRPQSLPAWVEASDWGNATGAEVDAVSGATQKPGANVVVWDCTDRNGRPVPAGKYRYIIEGNISWDTRVMWRGEIEVGGERNSSEAAVERIPPGGDKNKVLIEQVKAVYE